MSYSTNRDIIARLGSDLLATLHGGEFVPANLREARAVAAAEMESYLAAQAFVPVDTFDEVSLEARLRDIELALVEYAERLRAGENEMPERIKERREQSLDWLDQVRDRRVVLVPSKRPRGILSIETRRHDTRGADRRRNLEFNADVPAGSDAFQCEYRETDQPHWVADEDGYLEWLKWRASGDQDESAEIAVLVNGVAVALTATAWDGARRGYVQLAAPIAFRAGDRIGVTVTPAGAIAGEVDLKVMIHVRYVVTD